MRWSFPSTQHWWGHNWNNVSSYIPFPPFSPSTLQYERDLDIPEMAEQKITKMTMGLEHFTQEEMLRELGLSSLQKKELTGDHVNVHQYLKNTFQDKKQWTKDGTQQIPSEHQKALCCAGDSALAKAAKKDPRVYVLGDP